ncbi:MAG: twin-arginine translocase TatA/TatE family subunit [Alloprevotella sp.]|nr:twin-arginine translocase TatA/TatE family subunit [Alloprevotella sp.]
MIQPLFIGTTELLLISGVALLLFGGKKLPEMMRGMGKGVQEFKKGMHDVTEPLGEAKEELQEEPQEADAEKGGERKDA